LRTGSDLGARRVCLLTGAGGRLGDEFCRRYSAQYDIVAVYRARRPGVPSQTEQYVDPLDPAAALPENDAAVFTVQADLEQDGEVERVVDLALARFGGVDLLVNNAAFSTWYPLGLADGDGALRDLDRHFAMNVGVPLRMAVRLAQRFWMSRTEDNRARNRNVVNVSSMGGSKLFPGSGQGVYAASKSALNMLTRHLGAEFPTFGVRVNALAPNSFPSIVSTRRVAESIVQLDEEKVTGRILAVDAD
jgi:NAD(P)-dependent dehydrogenase (short-subunit alcohol dehydrogenase family)